MRLLLKPSMNFFCLCARFIGAIVASDGRSHWFEGVQLITLYLVTAMMFYFLPVSH